MHASLYKKRPGNYVICASNLYSAQTIYEFLLSFIPERKLAFFPADELLRAEALSSSKELMAQRLYAMGQLQNEDNVILITHPGALLRFTPDPIEFKNATANIKVGDVLSISDLKTKLLDAGYTRVNKVDQSLQFASRGDIFDIFSVSNLKPYRIEFFDDEVEAIKEFDVGTQESGKRLKSITVLPASDTYVPANKLDSYIENIRDCLNKNVAKLDSKSSEVLISNVERDIEEITAKLHKPYLYKYFGKAYKNDFNILNYFKPDFVYITDYEQWMESVNLLEEEAKEYFNELIKLKRIPEGLKEYIDYGDAIPKGIRVNKAGYFAKDSDDFIFNVRQILPVGTGFTAILPTIKSYLDNSSKVILCIPTKHQRDIVTNLLDENGLKYEQSEELELPKSNLMISSKFINRGFELYDLNIVCISESELYTNKVKASRYTSRFKDSIILKKYDDLKVGDYVVHETYGIGQFLGVENIESGGVHRDYLHIAYAKDDGLFVPLEQFRLVRKYSGREGYAPRLSSLSGNGWNNKKKKINERINLIADKLLFLYGSRQQKQGYAFSTDDEFQEKFESEFSYELTNDQSTSLEEIKKDMESPEIMDRLLIGDVGFGKTEVAFRAIFKAINSGKQAAILCPTTLLCRQHYDVANERFSSFGIRIAMISRNVKLSEQKKIIADLKDGKIDLIIGTHRLLSKEIKFNDLGLLVVDEEQRFGVEQKERIKEIKNNVDVLSLSATPIPRTLQMSLVGVRPMSQITTAPPSRMPIQTYVAPFKKTVVYELISRELARHGQVFYIHNRVSSMFKVAESITEKIPNANVGVVNGQMDRQQVEEVMEQFYDGSINVLVATSIIENGIDVPNANMIIVEDADRFGLAQLYQIKGRVGRGDRIAYAYLFYKANKKLNENAAKRLKAIQDFAELGSGYKIAQQDLMIRGAGDLLGPEQAGFIDSIGLDLYVKMLNSAIISKKEGIIQEAPKPKKMFKIDAYIPNDYAINSDKIQLYQELDNVKDENELEKFTKKIRDIYGPIPSETKLLIQKKKIDILADSSEFKTISEEDDKITIVLSDEWSQINGIGVEFFKAIIPYLDNVKCSKVGKNFFVIINKKEKWLDELYEILKEIHNLTMEHTNKECDTI